MMKWGNVSTRIQPIQPVFEQLRSALMHANGEMDAILTQLQDGVVCLDAADGVLFANQAAADLRGVPLDGLVGALWTDLPDHFQFARGETLFHGQPATLIVFRRAEILAVEQQIITVQDQLDSGLPLHYRLSWPEEVLLEMNPRVTHAAGHQAFGGRAWVQLWRERIHPADIARVLSNLVMLKVRGVVDLVYRVVSPSGRITWVQDISSLVPTENGAIERRGYLTGINHLDRMGELAVDRGQREKQILHALPDRAFVLDSRGRFIDLKINQMESGVIPPGMYTGRFLEEVLSPDDVQKAQSIIQRALQSDSVVEDEFVWTEGDRTTEFELRAASLDDSHVLVFLREIGERKRMERDLRDSEERLRGILESQNEMIVRVDRAGHFTYVNDAYCHKFGKTREELLRGEFMPLVHPEDLPNTLNSMEDLEKPPYRVYVEQRAMTVDGWRWLSWEDYAIRDAQGNIVEIQGVGRDIHEQRLAIHMLQDAKETAENANRAKSAFLSTMSHEIRTPLNSIVGMTSLLKTTPLTDEQRDYVDTARSSSETLLAIINDILDFSKIESGRLELEQQPFVVRDCVQEAIDQAAAMAAGKNLDIAYWIDSQVPQIVEGDGIRLRQVLLNLLGNAVKFTQQGEVVLSLSSRAVNGHWELSFEVRDTGIGIPTESLPQLFEPFTQAESSTARRFGGTGLGLAISRRLVEVMGGTISVESEVNRGSTFRFTIQTAVVKHAAEDEHDRSLLAKAAPLMIFSDNGATRQMNVNLLDGWGVRSISTGSFIETVNALQRMPEVHVVILDVNSDWGRNDCVCEQIQQRFPNRRLEWIVLHPLGMRPDVPSHLRIRGMFSKPIRQSQLYNLLMEIANVPHRSAARTSNTEVLAQKRPPVGDHRILLVEDNAVNQKVALRMLEKLGWKADLATNGVEAIQALERQAYSLVLMDVLMPEMDGVEATRRIRAQFPRERQPVIIAMTANAMEGERERYLAVGMDDYLGKPVTLSQLQAILRRMNLEP